MSLGFQKLTATSGMLAGLVGALALAGSPAMAQAAKTKVPGYKFDPTWPKLPLPHNWIVKSFGGIFVDKNDNVWVLSRPDQIPKEDLIAEQNPPLAKCCVRGPSVIEFSPKGDVLQAWGGQGYVPGWPKEEQAITIDAAGRVWLGGGQQGDTLMEFTQDGKLIRDFGKRGPITPKGEKPKMDNQETDFLLRGLGGVVIDDAAHEIYIADAYQDKRVLVYDLDTFAFKRGWGAYGKPLAEISNDPAPKHQPNDPPAKNFLGPVHCVKISNDNLVYVCDRGDDRVQVFTKQGKFVKEIMVDPETIDHGTPNSLAFSPDRKQRYLLASSFQNSNISIIDRASGKVVETIGSHGTNGGQFTALHVVAVDSKGDIYAGEVNGASRIQKFTPITPWPKN